ncbi:MAG TPA: extracellular solute-binding protein [Streptosporangiaceae bacterium]
MRTSWLTKITAATAALMLTAAACGGGESNKARPAAAEQGSATTSKLLLWSEGIDHKDLYGGSLARFNAANPKSPISLQIYENDSYKKMLQHDLTRPGAPDLFFNWGAANLKSLVDRGLVADITDELAADPSWKSRYLPSTLEAVTFNGRTYGVPMLSMQPVSFLYNKKAFARIGARPPKTLDDLFALIPRFQAKGITPVALAGKQPWTELMWMEYLVDRFGGPDVFRRIQRGDTTGWRDPAIRRAAETIRRLVDAGAFGKKFSSVSYDDHDPVNMLSSGHAAMELMGSWEYVVLLELAPGFVKNNDVGWFPFPRVAGGKGNPLDVVGNPSNFYSIRAASPHRKAAVNYLKALAADKNYQSWLVQHGEVPALKGVAGQLSHSDSAGWLNFVYSLATTAPHFQLSWDQAVEPATADVILDDLDQLFEKKIGPDAFVRALSLS